MQTELFSSLGGDSLLTIENEMKNVLISPEYKVHVLIADQISSEKVITYISKNRTLIKVNVGNTGQSIAKSLTLIGEKPTLELMKKLAKFHYF